MSEVRPLLESLVDALPEHYRMVFMLRDVFPFHLTRCDRIVAAVLEALGDRSKD